MTASVRSIFPQDESAAASPSLPLRVLMTIDAVGGVWRYAMDFANVARSAGIEMIFAGFGPLPSPGQRTEAERLGILEWLPAPLDWTAADEKDFFRVSALLRAMVREYSVDLLHANLPSQAAGIDGGSPVVAVSHSCVVTWFDSVHGTEPPQDWLWHKRLNSDGFRRADVVLAPSASHAAALVRCYGAIEGLAVLHNASHCRGGNIDKQQFVFAAARWWDEGKNGTALDAAAAKIHWPVLMAGACAGPNGQRLSFDHAICLGELGHEQVMALMSRAAIVVSPSIYEPFGLVALEAARLGAALVLADIPTYRELWDGAALFADPHNPRAFADAANELAGDAGKRAVIARSAQQRSADFTIEAQCAGLLSAYRKAVTRSMPSAAGAKR